MFPPAARGALFGPFLDAVDLEGGVGRERAAQEPCHVGAEQHDRVISRLDPAVYPRGFAGRGFDQQDVRLERREQPVGKKAAQVGLMVFPDAQHRHRPPVERRQPLRNGLQGAFDPGPQGRASRGRQTPANFASAFFAHR